MSNQRGNVYLVSSKLYTEINGVSTSRYLLANEERRNSHASTISRY